MYLERFRLSNAVNTGVFRLVLSIYVRQTKLVNSLVNFLAHGKIVID